MSLPAGPEGRPPALPGCPPAPARPLARRDTPSPPPPRHPEYGGPHRGGHPGRAGPQRGRAPRAGHRRGDPRPLAGHRARADPLPVRCPAARRQPAGLPARPGPGVVDLPDPRDLLLRRRVRGRPQRAHRRRLPGLAARAPVPAEPPGGGAGRRLGAAHRGDGPRRRQSRDDPHRADAGPRPALVPGRVRRAHRADPAGRGAGPPVRRRGRAAARRPGRRGGPGPVRPRRSRLDRLGQRRSRLAGPLPAGHRVGARGAARLEGPRPHARRGRRGHRGAGHLGRVSGEHGGRERGRDLEPEPAHAGRRHLRRRPGRASRCCCGPGWPG